MMKIPPEKATLNFYGGVRESKIPGLTFHGVYEQHHLPKICANIDVAIIPSIFQETFSLVLSEMWMGGLPVAVSDFGSLRERVIEGVNGKKFPPGDIKEIQDTIQWFLTHDEWKSWKIPASRALSDMAEEYRTIYNGLL